MLFMKYWRQKMHLSKEYIASLLDCPVDEYKNIEDGRQPPTSEQMNMLTKVFMVNENKLMELVYTKRDKRELDNLFVFQKNVSNR